MFKKHLLNKLKFYSSITLCSIAILATPVATMTVSASASNESIEICTDFREWRYKIVDDKLYKALFNNSTGQFETDWIYVCDWPEGI